VRLHMLQEAADVAALAAGGSLGPHERQRRLRWPERLRITQPSLAMQAWAAGLERTHCVLSVGPLLCPCSAWRAAGG